jgi:type I restriction enzyme S subunit
MSDLQITGWSEALVSDIISEIQTGVSVNSENRRKRASEIGILKTSCISRGQFFPEEHKAVLADEVERVKTPLKAQSILMSRMNTPSLVGEVGYAQHSHPDIYLPDRLWMFSGKEGISDTLFLSHLLSSDGFRQKLSDIATGTSGSMKNIPQSSFLQIPVQVPPLPEQKKIAEILSGIDKVMDLTKRKLASERDLRAALLNEMIAENRPFLKLEMVATRVSGHTPSKSNSGYWNGGIPWVSLSDMAKLDKRFICDTSKEISEQGIRNSSAVLHPAGLVILSRDARVGCSAITAKKMAVSQHFIGWICSERLLNTYLYYVLQKWKKKFEAIAMGSTIATIGVPFFRDLEIPVPPINEQQKAASALESIDDSIDMLEGKIVCLESLKNALASDLLSGRKRVTL